MTGPLGCFVVWRQMAFLADSLAHSMLLGIMLAMFFTFDIMIGIIVICFGFTVILVLLQERSRLASDSLLAVIAHSALAAGLVLASVLDYPHEDIHDFLFGDLMTLSYRDLGVLYGVGMVVLIGTLMIWRPLLAITVNEDLAQIANINVRVMRFIFTGLLALVIAMGIKVVGILLIASLLIIPPATAHKIARTPEYMALWAILYGVLSMIAGISLSWQLDISTGPLIVVMAMIFFIINHSLIRSK